MRTVGEFSWLLSFDDEDEPGANARARRVAALLHSLQPEGLVEAVPAARSVFVEGSPSFDAEILVGLEAGRLEAPAPEAASHEIRVTLGGEDLPEVCGALGLSPEAFGEALLEASYTVGFLGFSPGFPYLYGLPARLRRPRRRTPRLSVPAGSLAMAGPYVGIYPASMPGGWNLLGTVDAVLFDPERRPPALLAPGDTVRFRR
ncbi:MAG TPA: carboxyltransferase domain-containing protein [Thermoanaerobaculia bacterium]|nr:carboxyltransferase domain-containing protein [Thermoanaerobaculia bacterium]